MSEITESSLDRFALAVKDSGEQSVSAPLMAHAKDYLRRRSNRSIARKFMLGVVAGIILSSAAGYAEFLMDTRVAFIVGCVMAAIVAYLIKMDDSPDILSTRELTNGLTTLTGLATALGKDHAAVYRSTQDELKEIAERRMAWLGSSIPATMDWEEEVQVIKYAWNLNNLVEFYRTLRVAGLIEKPLSHYWAGPPQP